MTSAASQNDNDQSGSPPSGNATNTSTGNGNTTTSVTPSAAATAASANQNASNTPKIHKKAPSTSNQKKAKKNPQKSGKSKRKSAGSLEVDSKGIPIDFKDPISQLIMSDPVSTEAGTSYERESIERWLDTSDIDPITGLKLKTKMVFPNNALKNQITLFLERRPQFKQYLCAQGEYTLERIEHLLREENQIHEITKLLRKLSSNFFKKENKQNIMHLVFRNACSVGYIIKILEQQVIQQQLDKLLKQRDTKGHLPATWGIQNGSYEVFKYLVQNHKDTLLSEKQVNNLDAFAEDSRTHLSEHLMDSCSDGFLDGVKVLAHFGISLVDRVGDGMHFLPIEEAAYYGHSHIVSFICEKSKPNKTIINRAFGAAAEGHHIACMSVCLDAGAEINSAPDDFPCALTRAVTNLATVKFLVERGAQINVTHPSVNEEPFNPLSSAAQMMDDDEDSEYLRVMDYLIENGANVDYQDDRGWAAIHYAVRALNKKSIGKLIENECNVDLLTNDKKTVYDLADEYADSESLGEDDSSIDESVVQGSEHGGAGAGDDDILIEEDNAVDNSRHSRNNDRSRDASDHYHIFMDDNMDDTPMFMDDDVSSDMSSTFESDPDTIKDFIKEHSKLVKRLRQSMVKKDITVLSTEMGALKKQYEDVCGILREQTRLIKTLVHRGPQSSEDEPNSPALGDSVDTDFTSPNANRSVGKKRKRKKSISGSKKKKQKQQ